MLSVDGRNLAQRGCLPPLTGYGAWSAFSSRREIREETNREIRNSSKLHWNAVIAHFPNQQVAPSDKRAFQRGYAEDGRQLAAAQDHALTGKR
jgi:hypothetical protein